ncbi:choline/ethanolamine phosphotransferase [Kipferlia bialata]|uniref:Choline/ethanolamine phosphotransferase n=1 Tax=Kipferlia bialata TaxID=797122 RepID=A0A9K3GJY7_9EUKA|nr:choline/ethanolamine phosphotransferase [Kipferlia bialata]|eukprot:g6603.t1
MAPDIPTSDDVRDALRDIRDRVSLKEGVLSHLPVPSLSLSLPALSDDAIHNLTNYKYTGIDLSPVSRYVLQPLWRWQAEHVMDHVPWLSPNGVTLMGLCVMTLAQLSFILSSLIYTGAPSISSGVWFLVAVCMLMYQNCDGVDGVHARRTNTCSCLGQIFDHGIDSLGVTVFITMLLFLIRCDPVGLVLGVPIPWPVLIAGTAGSAFVCYQAEEFLCHVLKLDVVSFPVEGILLAAGGCITLSLLHDLQYDTVLPAISSVLYLPVVLLIGSTFALGYLTYAGATWGIGALEDRQREREGETIPGTPGVDRKGATSGPITPNGMSHKCALRCTVTRLIGVTHPATMTLSVSPLLPYTIVPLVCRWMGVSGMAEIVLCLLTALTCFAVYFVGCVALPISRTLGIPLLAMRRQE